MSADEVRGAALRRAIVKELELAFADAQQWIVGRSGEPDHERRADHILAAVRRATREPVVAWADPDTLADLTKAVETGAAYTETGLWVRLPRDSSGFVPLVRSTEGAAHE